MIINFEYWELLDRLAAAMYAERLNAAGYTQSHVDHMRAAGIELPTFPGSR